MLFHKMATKKFTFSLIKKCFADVTFFFKNLDFKESIETINSIIVKVGPPVHNYEHEAGSYGDGFT